MRRASDPGRPGSSRLLNRLLPCLLPLCPLLLCAASAQAAVDVNAPAGPVQENAGCRSETDRFCGLRIYQVMVEAFVDGDADHDYGDGYGTSHHRGDLRGIIQSLDYIAGLGMNALWLTPVFDSHAGEPQLRLNGDRVVDLKLDATGYFTRDYFSVDPRFGTLDDARELVREAHRRGMYVFFDAVFGHHKGDLVPSPSGKLPADSTDPADYFGNPAGYPGRVVDFGDPRSLAFFREVATWWIDEVGIDGWRLDQAYQVPLDAWREIRAAVEAASARRGGPGSLVAEIFSGADDIAAQAFGTDQAPALASAFDFPLRWATVGVLASEEDPSKSRRPASTLAEPWAYGAHDSTYPAHALPNLMLGNHDFVRFGDLLQRASIADPEDAAYWARHRLAFLVQAAYSGPITRYYGEELGDELPGFAARVVFDCASRGLCDDHVARTSGKVPGVSLAESELSQSQRDLLDFHRRVMAVRDRQPALSHGSRQHLYSDDRLYVDLKSYAGQQVVFAMNTGEEATEEVVLRAALFERLPATAWDLLADAPLATEGDALRFELAPLEGRLILLGTPADTGFRINAGIADAWFNPATPGQGFMIAVFEPLRLMFLAWFTFDTDRPADDVTATLGDAGHRWLTALGRYEGHLAELEVELTRGGVFDRLAPQPEQTPYGKLQLEFQDCENAILRFDLPLPEVGPVPGVDDARTLPMRRLVPDNAALCEALNAQ
ncbi:MAG: alpha-amylase family glycosyl hydrolase [Gammaproteobacteria bacterium]